jgi:hypothetical protein
MTWLLWTRFVLLGAIVAAAGWLAWAAAADGADRG